MKVQCNLPLYVFLETNAYDPYLYIFKCKLYSFLFFLIRKLQQTSIQLYALANYVAIEAASIYFFFEYNLDNLMGIKEQQTCKQR